MLVSLSSSEPLRLWKQSVCTCSYGKIKTASEGRITRKEFNQMNVFEKECEVAAALHGSSLLKERLNTFLWHHAPPQAPTLILLSSVSTSLSVTVPLFLHITHLFSMSPTPLPLSQQLQLHTTTKTKLKGFHSKNTKRALKRCSEIQSLSYYTI